MPSDDKTSSLPIRAMLRIVRKAMHEYDCLGDVPKIHWEPPSPIVIEPKIPTRFCTHNVPYHEVCTKCGRDSEDCKAYIVAAQQRIRDLLRTLEGGTK